MIGRRFSLPAPTRSKSGRQLPVASNTNTDARQRKCTTKNCKTACRAHPSCVAWKLVVSAVSPHLEPRIGTDSLRCTPKLENQHGSGMGQVLEKGLQPHSSDRTMKTACNRGVICCMILKDKTLQQDAQTEGAWSSNAHRWAEWPSRLVIRRIQAGQIISVVTASSHHPHFASQFSDSFERNLDISVATPQITGDTPEVHRRADAGKLSAGAPSTANFHSETTAAWSAMRDYVEVAA